MRVTIVQYGGDYREAFERFSAGGKATYQAQRYSVGFVGSLATRFEQVAVVCGLTDEPYDVFLANGVRAIGAGLTAGFDAKSLTPLIAKTDPDRLVLTIPSAPILKWARRNSIPTLGVFADSFERAKLTSRLRNVALARHLRSPNVAWVGNHGIGACLSLRNIGAGAEKIIPWDWPPSHFPADFEPRRLSSAGPMRLLFVGSITEAKGVGDLLVAMSELRRLGVEARLAIIGHDRDEGMKNRARELRIAEDVDFHGIAANEDVPRAMRDADVVIVPSRHEYPEGLPLTIYEALATRTPIIASDHPMFRGVLVDRQSALVFPASDPLALARAVERLSREPELYCALSLNSERAWQGLQLPVQWGNLIDAWLTDSADGRAWLAAHRLNSGLYDTQIAQRR